MLVYPFEIKLFERYFLLIKSGDLWRQGLEVIVVTFEPFSSLNFNHLWFKSATKFLSKRIGFLDFQIARFPALSRFFIKLKFLDYSFSHSRIMPGSSLGQNLIETRQIIF